MLKKLEGYKTYVGLVVVLLGMLGAGKYISEGQLTELIDAILKIAGIVVAVYGNYDAHRRLEKIQ